MADLQRAQEGHAFGRFAASSSAALRRGAEDETGRPRIGRRPRRAKRRRRSRFDTGVALRALGISCAVAAFVLGGFFLLHSLGLGRGAEEMARAPQQSAMVAAAGLIPATAEPAPAAPPADAGRIAALLNSEPAPPPAGDSAAPAGPSSADFSRPAFLEPRAAEAADAADADAADDPAPRAAPAPQAGPTGPVPLPAARPLMARAATEQASAEQAPAGQADAADAEETGSVGQEGRITTAINLRSAPRRGSTVLGTLAAGTRVTVYSCKSWCEVAAGDKRGYVYSRAVDH